MPEKFNTTSEAKPTVDSTSSFDKTKLISTIKSLQFAWFVGHVITLVSIFFFSLTYIKLFKYYRFWYQAALFGIIESFGILIYQLVSKKNTKYSALIKDDNVQYFLLSVGLLITRPYVLLTLLPFALFSTFHVLAYTKAYLLPVFGLDNKPISKHIGEFISKNNVKSVQLAAVLENLTLGLLFFRLITFRSRSLFPFLLYVVFIKVRFEKSPFTRNHVKKTEVFVDHHVNKSEVPAVKQAWLNVKQVFRKLGSIHLVNDYTKEKST